MEEKLRLDIVTPYGKVFGEDVDEVTASGSEGEFGVLPGHASFVTTLRAGILSCRQGSKQSYFFVSWGYAEVGPDKVVVLADSAERAEEIDVQRATEARKRAEERLKQQEDVDFARAESALERAVSRIHIAEHFVRK